MTFEQFAVVVHDWARRLSPRQFRAEVACQLASEEGVEGLSRDISIEAALVMVRMGLGPGMRPVDVHAARAPESTPDDTAIIPPSPRKSSKAPRSRKGRVFQQPDRPERRGRPSKRAQAPVREQLANGPKRSEEVQAAAEAAEISERTLIAAADALGVRARKGQWWIPGRIDRNRAEWSA